MSWDNFKQHYLAIQELGFSLDVSRIRFSENFFAEQQAAMDAAFAEMEALEGGAIANADEQRMVGHYWLRNPALAPEASIRDAIAHTVKRIGETAAGIRDGSIQGQQGVFKNLLCIGIGGSALGPQFVEQALGGSPDALKLHFFDNTDPDGMDHVLRSLRGQLGQTLVIVTSKSGGTPETRNGMIEAEAAWTAAGLDFPRHAIAVTGEGSKLDKHAREAGWIARFPMWDWVGGRTSELGPVGLLPAALAGIDIDALLRGAREMDEATRVPVVRQNPAAMLALAWFQATDGKGRRDMVILPYKDRLQLFSRYLQQLVMESLGKEFDRNGNTVHQGIAVYGNKGSTDQHAYVQQLRDGVENFFVTFIEVLRDREGSSVAVEDAFTSGDYLHGLLLGTRDALWEKGRQSITLTVETVCPHSVGQLIALYERAVGFYASLVNINAYHQPGVEAGKKGAAQTLQLRAAILEFLNKNKKCGHTAEAIAAEIPADAEAVFKILNHLAANPERGVRRQPTKDPLFAKFSLE